MNEQDSSDQSESSEISHSSNDNLNHNSDNKINNSSDHNLNNSPENKSDSSESYAPQNYNINIIKPKIDVQSLYRNPVDTIIEETPNIRKDSNDHKEDLYAKFLESRKQIRSTISERQSIKSQSNYPKSEQTKYSKSRPYADTNFVPKERISNAKIDIKRDSVASASSKHSQNNAHPHISSDSPIHETESQPGSTSSSSSINSPYSTFSTHSEFRPFPKPARLASCKIAGRSGGPIFKDASTHTVPEQNQQWFYLDDELNVQGPVSASNILRWSICGLMDEMQTYVMKEADPSEAVLLSEVWTEIVNEVSFNKRSTITKKKIETPLEEYTESLEKPFNFDGHILRINDYSQYLYTEKLHQKSDENLDKTDEYMNFSTDTDLIIVPSDYLTSESVDAHIDEIEIGGRMDSDCCDGSNSNYVPPRQIRMHVHSFVLKMSSPVLRKIIEMKEYHLINDTCRDKYPIGNGTECPKPRVDNLSLVISVCNPMSIVVIVRCLYGESETLLTTIDVSLLISVLSNAIRLRVYKLVDKCCEALDQPLPLSSLLDMAWIFQNDEHNSDSIVDVMAECAFFVLSGTDHYRLSDLSFDKLMRSDRLMMQESGILDLVRKYRYMAKHRDAKTEEAQTEQYSADKPINRTEIDKYVSFNATVRHKIKAYLGPRQAIRDFNKKHGPMKVTCEKTETGMGVKDIALRLDCLSFMELLGLRNDTSLDTPLLNAILKKHFNLEGPRRTYIWQGYDSSYKVITYETRYPARLQRVGTIDLCPNTEANRSLEAVHTHAPPNVVLLHWISGESRMATEISWAFEVSNLKSGNLGCGLVVENESPNVYSDNVYYFDTNLRCFCKIKVPKRAIGGAIKQNFVHQDKQRFPSWSRRLNTSEVIYIRVSVTSTIVYMTVGVWDPNLVFSTPFTNGPQNSQSSTQCCFPMNATFQFPLKHQPRLSQTSSPRDPSVDILKYRRWIKVKPWFALFDAADEIKVPKIIDDESIVKPFRAM